MEDLFQATVSHTPFPYCSREWFRLPTGCPRSDKETPFPSITDEVWKSCNSAISECSSRFWRISSTFSMDERPWQGGVDNFCRRWKRRGAQRTRHLFCSDCMRLFCHRRCLTGGRKLGSQARVARRVPSVEEEPASSKPIVAFKLEGDKCA